MTSRAAAASASACSSAVDDDGGGAACGHERRSFDLRRSWVTAACFTAAGSSALAGHRLRLDHLAARAGPGGPAQPGRGAPGLGDRRCLAGADRLGGRLARHGALAQTGHQGVLVDLVGVEAAQLVGEALGVAAVGQGQRCAPAGPAGDSVAVLPSTGRTRSTVPLARSSRTEMMPLRLRARAIDTGQRSRTASQPASRSPDGESVRRDDGGR